MSRLATSCVRDICQSVASDVTDKFAGGITWNIAVDKSGNGNNGTLFGLVSDPRTTSVVSGASGKAIALDGDDDLIDFGTIGIGNPLMLNGSAGSISVWIKKEAGGDIYQRVFDKSDGGGGANGYALSVGSVAGLENVLFNIDGVNVFTSTSDVLWTEDTWTHILVTWDATGGNAVCYIDGVSVAGTQLTKVIPNVATNARIGSWNHDVAREFKGDLDELIIFNAQLTADNATYLYNSFRGVAGGTNPGTANRVGYWDMDGGTFPNWRHAADSVGYNVGILAGFVADPRTTSVVSGASGKAIALDGDDDLVDLSTIAVGNPLMLNGSAGSISVWIKKEAGGDAGQRIFDKSDGGNAANGYGLYAGSSVDAENFRLIIDGVTVFSSTSSILWTPDTWTHLLVTWDATGGNAVGYVNGSSVAGTQLTKVIPNVATNARIGSWNHDVAREFKGDLDELIIFNAQLTADNAIYLYRSFRGVAGGTDPGDGIAHWNFN